MTISIFESKLKNGQIKQFTELVTLYAWRMERQATRPVDDTTLERAEAMKILLSIRSFLNRYGILIAMHHERIRMIIAEWFESRHSKEEIQELFDQLDAKLTNQDTPLLVPWTGHSPKVPWREKAYGHGFEMAIGQASRQS